ncbi:hypothetical protein EV361DRAFT_89804 [Lentinula raphanica]|uniref:SUZ domain-containing protein n=1 Tax=Lentinula raphanica TaxID=153919 RepID=A0AA38PDU9_9AGAR|nr:hypothetical protein EV360DRAFT_88122 [Lentinula raphanica]KAJ3774603.1 hypothetical protein FB446DRAFT_728330 [Lentinula raphanica]KAJ3819287.1 hypothetical protein F5880DRAFT_1595088 [Lentinula raphanica]KAJ3840896.1 hypothetical protein F5878DRAFT_708453 [Lentinula raphanica]KAJ3973069.1 hypothetical protein EV361DRAFT_89804 [Lentinula raphanica]
MLDDTSGWGEPDPPSTLRRSKAPSEVVRDDWEDDDDEEEPQEEKNKKIWHKANHEAAAPMPTFIVSSSNIAPPPPAAALQPAFQILKRPVNNPETTTPFPQQSSTKESLEDREARYEVARNRIFGVASGSASDTESTLHAKKKDVVVIRHPRGPDDTYSTDSVPANGFEKRSKTLNTD